jgi:hypothetical protein
MRQLFGSAVLFVCITLTSLSLAEVCAFASLYERNWKVRGITGEGTGICNPALVVCETNRAATPPSRETSQAGFQAAPGRVSPTAVIKFTRLSVKDPGANNIEAVTCLIPAGWKAEGGVQWFPNHLILANLLMRVSDPQTGAAIEFLPGQYFSWPPIASYQPQGGNYMGCILWPPIQEVPEFIRTFYYPGALARLQGARIVQAENLSKIAAQVAQFHGGQSSALCGRVRYDYQADGFQWEEDVYVTLVYTPGQPQILWSGTGYSFRAHQGYLDRLIPLMNTTTNTLRQSPEWFGYYLYVRKLFLNRMAQGIRNAGILSEAITRNSAEIRQMFEDSYRRTNQSQDRISRSYSEYIRGVETYRNPYEDRPIQLPTGYDGVWVSRSGEYLLSNQPGFNPNVGSPTEWRRMERSP